MKQATFIIITPLWALAGLIVAGILHMSGHTTTVTLILEITIIVGAIPLAWKLVRDALKGHFGVDVVAISAIVVSLVLRQYLAGAVIVLMLAGGEALELYALQRAQRQLTHLLSRSPSVAHIKRGESLADVAVAEVKVGDMVVVKSGEIIPVDGVVTAGDSEVDESTLTGESVPVNKLPHSTVSSGTTNKEGSLTIKALRPAAQSQYERIVALVKQAQASRAPIVRLADRYAGVFTIVTFTIAFTAWYVSQSSTIFLSVLVVATPCSLILATPIAVMSGISKAASRGIIVKNGGALERLGEAKSFVFDKTGTLTVGEPQVLGSVGKNLADDEVMFLSASLDQLSTHIFARSLVKFARHKLQKTLAFPEQFQEVLGQGVIGKIDQQEYLFGKLSFLKSRGVQFTEEDLQKYEQAQTRGVICVYLGRGLNLLGWVEFADVVRAEIKPVFVTMRGLGIKRLVMLTGDKELVAGKIAQAVGITEYKAGLLPQQKLAEVEKIKQQSGPVVMVGDGINDAPALAAADVGIALGAHGATAASEAGDIVVTVNNVERVSQALAIAKRVLQIAKQSIFIGIGVSIILMIIASFGVIPPVTGAVLQEILDVAVIFNALRVNLD